MSFLDKVKIYVKAGKGGDGCLSFRREKFIEFGGPNGGSGGAGGSVYIKAEPNLTTLLELAYNPHIKAKDGEKGGTYNKSGHAAQDLYLHVPCGTIIKKDGHVMADLTEPGSSVMVAEGGRGGRGNQSFKSTSNTAPRIAEIGQEGEAVTLHLELKVLADVGLAGFPNAGKSTLLSSVSAARPKVADYPFTTLNPNLGIVMHKGKSFVMADIPGIIEGASEGKGLGLQFLKHIERTRVLLQLVDPLGFKGASAADSVKIIEDELKKFDKKLLKKPRIIAVNKSDLPEAKEAYEKIKKKYKKHMVLLISGATGAGTGKLLDEVTKLLNQIPVELEADKEKEKRVFKVEPLFKIYYSEDGAPMVTGRKIEDMVQMTNFMQPEAVKRLHNTFKKMKLEKALLKLGVADGDIVNIGGREFEWTGSAFDNDLAAQPEHAGYKRRTTADERLALREQRRKRKAEKEAAKAAENQAESPAEPQTKKPAKKPAK